MKRAGPAPVCFATGLLGALFADTVDDAINVPGPPDCLVDPPNRTPCQ